MWFRRYQINRWIIKTSRKSTGKCIIVSDIHREEFLATRIPVIRTVSRTTWLITETQTCHQLQLHRQWHALGTIVTVTDYYRHVEIVVSMRTLSYSTGETSIIARSAAYPGLGRFSKRVTSSRNSACNKSGTGRYRYTFAPGYGHPHRLGAPESAPDMRCHEVNTCGKNNSHGVRCNGEM